MPLPIILGAAAIAAAAIGAKKGYDGHQKHSEADEIVRKAQARYNEKKTVFDRQEEIATSSLEVLGKRELEIGKDLAEFKTLADGLLRTLRSSRQTKLDISIPKHQLQKIESYSYTAVGVLGTIAGAGATGAAAGFAVYGGVMALGAASTGTAISSLAGVAATNATLAAIGGGSLAAGGLGMAGGTAILGATIAGPILAIAGWAYDSHGEAALANARKADREVDKAIEKLDVAVRQLRDVQLYAQRVNSTLVAIHSEFLSYFEDLKRIDRFLQDAAGRNVDLNAELEKFGDEVMRIIENGYALASILVNLIMTPIFKLKKEGGKVVKNNEGMPEMEKDEAGSMILNQKELDEAIVDSTSTAGGFAKS